MLCTSPFPPPQGSTWCRTHTRHSLSPCSKVTALTKDVCTPANTIQEARTNTFAWFPIKPCFSHLGPLHVLFPSPGTPAPPHPSSCPCPSPVPGYMRVSTETPFPLTLKSRLAATLHVSPIAAPTQCPSEIAGTAGKG